MSDRIRKLNEERCKRQQQVLQLRMMNAYGLDPEQRLKQDAAYRLANDAWIRSELDYQNAIRDMTAQELAELAYPSATTTE